MAWYKCKKGSSIELVPWSTGTDAQIKAMVDAYYDGKLTLQDIQSVWSIGAEREVQLSAMPATGVDETHNAQSVKFVIVNWGGKTLNDGNNTECLAIVEQKNGLFETGKMNSTNSNIGGWHDCLRRRWCNSIYKDAIPATFRELFKEHKNPSADGYGTLADAIDYFALPSEYEILGLQDDATAIEGSQFAWHQFGNKYKTNGEGGSRASYWLRSCTASTTQFCGIAKKDASSGPYLANAGLILAPFGCI